MNKPYIFVTPKQYLKHCTKWLKWLDYDESVVITFPYLNDRAIRIKQFSDTLKNTENYCPIIFDPNTDFFDEYLDLENFISKNQIEKKKTILIIPNGDSLLLPQNTKYFEYLERYRTQNIENFNTLIAFESNFQSKIQNIFSFTLLFQNLDFYPLYEQEDVLTFINSCLEPTWDIKLPKDLTKTIVNQAGGSYWLTKEAVRIYRDTGTFDPQNPGFMSKINSLAHTLNPKEQKIILSAPKLQNFKESQDYVHLKRTSFLIDHDICAIPLLVEATRQIYTEQYSLQIVTGEIYLGSINVSMMLSKNENSILKGLMQKPNTPISRDEIASIIWQGDAENRYSTWAIDQAAKRLRDKLIKIGLPATTIKSIRGVGYEYRN